jgi:hypothetical protein
MSIVRIIDRKKISLTLKLDWSDVTSKQSIWHDEHTNSVLQDNTVDVNGVLRKVSFIAHELVVAERKPGKYPVLDLNTNNVFVVIKIT